MKDSNKFKVILTFITFIIVFSSYGQNKINNLTGTWAGESSPDSFALSFRIKFEITSAGLQGTYSSEEQRALDIPLQKIAYDSLTHRLMFSLVGDADAWHFEGHVSGPLITGTITKRNQKADFALVKQKNIPLNYTRDEITFFNDTVKLSGSLYLPTSSKKIPAIIVLHGSGSEPRFASAYFADYFAKLGIAVLIYDKRGVGKSTGNWQTSTFEDLTNDAIAGINFLEKNKQIDARKIGVYGHSQGGSICPMLLTMYPALSFGISAASAGVSMRESDWYEVKNRFKRYVSGKDYDYAMQVMDKYLHYASTGKEYNALIAAAKEYENKEWFKNYIGNIDSTNFFFRYYRKIANYNAVDYWKKVKQPVLILKGDQDLVSPGYPSFQNIENALKQASNKSYQIVMFPNTSHEMHVVGKSTDFWFKATPNYLETIYTWLKKTIIEK